MNEFVETFKVKKVIRREGYQEVFISPKRANGSKSIRIYGCEQDIGSMLKKSFFDGRSVLDVHSLRSFPVKLYLDGVLIMDLQEKDYPEELKISLMKDEDIERLLHDQLFAFLSNYPKKNDFEVAVYEQPSVLLKAYAGALVGKALKNGLLNDELLQRHYSLMLDLLKLFDSIPYHFYFSTVWPPHWVSNDDMEDMRDEIAKRLNIQGCSKLILMYLISLVSSLRNHYKDDVRDLDRYIFHNYGVLSGKRLDKEILLNYDKPLSLCQSSKDVPNFIIDAQLSLEEIKYYLSQQNW